jgi:YbbR domain-containing protein
MILKPLRWLGKNLGTLLLAFVLAMVVWASAVTSQDPNEPQDFPRPVLVEVSGKEAGLILTAKSASQIRLRLEAPRSVWAKMTNDDNAIHAWVDLSGLAAGTHTVPVQVQVDARPVRIMRVTPEQVQVTLEPLVTQSITVTLVVNGTTAQGYKAEAPTLDVEQVNISGPQSLVAQAHEVRATLDFANATQTIQTTLPLSVLDANGDQVQGLTLTPASVTVTQRVNLLGGYRNVIVKVVTTGQVANGYQLTNIYVTPPNKMLFSENPQLVNDLPGYVETRPVDLTDVQDYFEALVELNLPKGISAVDDSKVLVQFSVAPIISSINVSLPVELTGLTQNLEAQLAPKSVDVILSGPVPVLSALKPADIRATINLTGYDVGTYRITPTIEFLPGRVEVVSISPQTVNIILTLAPTPTPTPTPTVTPTPAMTPTPSATPTRTPKPTP